MTVINTNVAAKITANALTKNERDMSQAMERLSTGLRINSAGDDAAALRAVRPLLLHLQHRPEGAAAAARRQLRDAARRRHDLPRAAEGGEGRQGQCGGGEGAAQQQL